MNDEIALKFKRLTKSIESIHRELDRQQFQIGRLVQLIGEFDLNDSQKYYLKKAIWGDDDGK